MTDNLANEPTEAQLLAALNGHRAAVRAQEGSDSNHERLMHEWPTRNVEAMRAALVAAQGAAPVLPSSTVDEGRMSLAELEDMAETHAFCADRLFIETELVDEIRAERDAALARIAEAAKLHRPRKHWNSDREYVFFCDECTRINRYGIAQWPCPTAVALGLN